MSLLNKEEHLMRRVSVRTAKFIESYDPYGFRDALEEGETVGDGLARASDVIYGKLEDREYGTVIGWVMEPRIEDDLWKEQYALFRELVAMAERDGRKNRKNVLGQIRRD